MGALDSVDGVAVWGASNLQLVKGRHLGLPQRLATQRRVAVSGVEEKPAKGRCGLAGFLSLCVWTDASL